MLLGKAFAAFLKSIVLGPLHSVDEFIALTEKFAEVVLNLDVMEMLDKLCQYYQEAKQNEAQDETNVH